MLGRILDGQHQTVVNLNRFRPVDYASEEDVLFAADTLSEEFYCSQDGFVKRELLATENNEFADILYWRSSTHADKAASKIELCITYLAYSNLIKEVDSLISASRLPYRVLRTWLPLSSEPENSYEAQS